MRPTSLDEVAGQSHLLRPGSPLVALADPALCRKALKEVEYFTVNFPSHRPEVYARVTRSVKFRQALAGLDGP